MSINAKVELTYDSNVKISLGVNGLLLWKRIIEIINKISEKSSI